MKTIELEAKFHVKDLGKIRERLSELGAEVSTPRVFELNIRLDTPDKKLTRRGQVLRLRQDKDCRLTFKGLGGIEDGVLARKEIEFSVSDIQAARCLFEALEFVVYMTYEKFRTVYHLEGVEICLDELPYGDFIEIEGLDPSTIKEISKELGLDWDTGIIGSYTDLFDTLNADLDMKIRDLTFINFEDFKPSHLDLYVKAADST